jgi:hypothetical protein
MKLTQLIILLLLSNLLKSQTISGFVYDAISKEPIMGAVVFCNDNTSHNKAVVSNNYGFYSLKLKSDSAYIIVVFYLGYKKQQFTISPTKMDSTYTIYLENNATTGEVEITANVINNNSQVFTANEIKKIPVFLGESDAIKAFQTQPGVKQGAEGFGSLIIRGGSAEQVQYILDDMPLYYVNHMGGFISTFNTDAISKVELFKNHTPANYSGRLSGVFDVRLKEGNATKWSGTVAVGLLSTRLNFNGPVFKNKSTLEISARRLNIDLISTPIFKLLHSATQPQYAFSDVMLKYTHKLSSKLKLSVSLFNSYDAIDVYKKLDDFKTSTITYGSTNDYVYNWSNTTGAIRLMHSINSRLFVTSVINAGMFTNNLKLNTIANTNGVETSNYLTTIKLNFKNASAKTTFDYSFNNNIKLLSGINYELISSGLGNQQTTVKTQNYNNTETYIGDKTLSQQIAVFATSNIAFTSKLKASIGFNNLIFTSNHFTKNYFQPRVLVQYQFTKNNSSSISYCQNVQPMHLLTNNGVGMPNDIWVPADNYAKPQQATQLNINYTQYFYTKKYSLQADVYYKTMENLIRYKDGYSVYSTKNDWHSTIETQGKGLSYGLEILAKKETGKLTGFIAYTLSKTTNQFANVNNGNPFNYKYDRRHELNVFANYAITPKININANFYFATGNAITLPTAIYNVPNISLTNAQQYTYLPNYGLDNGFNNSPSNFAFAYDGVNQQRTTNFHRLDIGANFTKQKKHGVRIWSLGIYNVYNHQNPFAYQYDYSNNQFNLKSISFFQIMPYITYEYKF